MDNTKELTAISFCAGYGGIERGLELAGVRIRVVAYVEIESYAIANLVAKMESGELAPAPIYTDVKTFPASYFRGKVDIFTGGYPCQPFSLSGKGLAQEDPRHLWPYLLEHIRAVRPVRCLWENVYGHVHRGLEEVLSDMEAEGYQTEFGIFSASEVGSVHERKRVFILADSNSPHSEGGWIPSRVQPEQSINHGSDVTEGGATPQFWEDEPRISRMDDGSTDWLDRVRMLGNGVVPQTACRAWQVLSRRFIDEQRR